MSPSQSSIINIYVFRHGKVPVLPKQRPVRRHRKTLSRCVRNSFFFDHLRAGWCRCRHHWNIIFQSHKKFVWTSTTICRKRCHQTCHQLYVVLKFLWIVSNNMFTGVLERIEYLKKIPIWKKNELFYTQMRTKNVFNIR